MDILHNITKEHILLMKAPAGSGKSTIALSGLTFSSNRVFWVASRREHVNNIPEECLPYWHIIEGRGRKNCTKYELANELSKKSHRVKETLCVPLCDIDQCIYYQQFDEKRKHWFVQQNFFLYTNDSFTKNFNLIVIDESITEAFRQVITITISDVEKNILLFEQTFKNNKWILLLKILMEVMKQELRLSSIETGTALIHRFKNTTKSKFAQSLEELLKTSHKPEDKLFFIPREEEGDNGKIKLDDYPVNFFDVFFNILYFELLEKHPENELSRICLSKVEGENILSLYYKVEKDTKKPMIILDATGKPDIYELLFGRPVFTYEPQVKLANEVVQVYSTSNSLTSLKRKHHFEKNIKVLKNIIKPQEKTLIVTKHKFVSEIEKALPVPDVIHFYGTASRGSNDYKEHDTVVIFGMPQDRLENIEKLAAILLYNVDRKISTTPVKIQRTYNYVGQIPVGMEGKVPAIKVWGFEEPILQAILETSREDEMLQALYRIRPISDPAKKIVLLTNIPIPGLHISKLVHLNELLPEGERKRPLKDVVRDAVLFLVDKVGFVQRKNMLDPMLIKNISYVEKLLRNAYHAKGLLYEPENKMSLRSINSYYPVVSEELNLQPFDLFIEGGINHLTVHGKNEECLPNAKSFLEEMIFHTSGQKVNLYWKYDCSSNMACGTAENAFSHANSL